jgi:Holliday junction resolvase
LVNRNYAKGRYLEYRIKKHYEKLGYHVVRSYASKGAADLYCMKECHSCANCIATTLYLVQAKNYNTAKRKVPKIEQQALVEMAKKTGGIPLIISNVNHKLRIEQLPL